MVVNEITSGWGDMGGYLPLAPDKSQYLFFSASGFSFALCRTARIV